MSSSIQTPPTPDVGGDHPETNDESVVRFGTATFSKVSKITFQNKVWNCITEGSSSVLFGENTTEVFYNPAQQVWEGGTLSIVFVCYWWVGWRSVGFLCNILVSFLVFF